MGTMHSRCVGKDFVGCVGKEKVTSQNTHTTQQRNQREPCLLFSGILHCTTNPPACSIMVSLFSLHTRTTHPPHTHHTRTTHSLHTHHTPTTHSPHTHYTQTTRSLHTHHTLTTHKPMLHHTQDILNDLGTRHPAIAAQLLVAAVGKKPDIPDTLLTALLQHTTKTLFQRLARHSHTIMLMCRQPQLRRCVGNAVAVAGVVAATRGGAAGVTLHALLVAEAMQPSPLCCTILAVLVAALARYGGGWMVGHRWWGMVGDGW